MSSPRAIPVDRAADQRIAAKSRTHPKTVLIFDGYYATLGGNQSYICMLLAAGAGPQNRWRPILACSGEGRLAEAARATGGEVHVVPQPKELDRRRSEIAADGTLDRIRTTWAVLSYNLRILSLLRRLRPDAIQCHSTRNALMAGFAARIAGIPMVLFVKGAMDTPLYDRVAVHLARRTVFLTEALRPDWLVPRIARSPEEFPVLPIGIDLSRADAAALRVAENPPRGLVLEPGTVNFASAGWLVPGKGIHVLIEAFARLVSRHPDCRLHILGTSDDKAYVDRLHGMARDLTPANTVRFLGWRADVLDILAVIDAFVLPSFSEGVPRSIVEAMAFGKSVIATSVGGIPALLGHGAFGTLVSPGDAHGLADALERIAANPLLRQEIGHRARAEARSRYSFDAHLTGLWSTLDSACRKRSAFKSN